MMLGSGTYQVMVTDRGGLVPLGMLDGIERLTLKRPRDDTGSCMLILAGLTQQCQKLVADIHPVRHEIVILRNGMRVWEGPITRLAFYGERVEIDAYDVTWYLSRRVLDREYDFTGSSVNAIQFLASMIRDHFDPNDDPFNVGKNVRTIASSDDAKTAARWVPVSRTLFEILDKYAEDGGIDYVVIDRSILIMDTHVRGHVLPKMTNESFNSDIGIVEYGSELVTRAYVTDGQGNYSRKLADDQWLAYYGKIDKLSTNVQEGAATEPTDATQAEANKSRYDQADRMLTSGYPAPIDILVPANTSLDPCIDIDYMDLHPNAWVEIDIEVGSRRASQWQRIQEVETTVEVGVETVSISLQQPPSRWVDPV
jgi:hypothetical protein